MTSVAFLLFVLPLFALKSPVPHWIWGQGQKLPDHVWFRKDFKLNHLPKSAELHITCDDEYVLYVNGVRIANNFNWYNFQDVSIRPYLKTGKNILAVDARNIKAAAGLLVGCILDAGSRQINLDSNLTWKASTQVSIGWKNPEFDDSGWTAPIDEGRLGVAPWGFPSDSGVLLRKMEALPQANPRIKVRPNPFSPDLADGFIWSKIDTGIHGHFEQMQVMPVSPTEARLKNRKISKPTVMKLDFGRELAGWVSCTVTSKLAPEVHISVGEASTPQPRYTTVETHNGDRWTFTLLPTDFSTSLTPNCEYTGFRYAWIHFDRVPTPATIDQVHAVYRMLPANYEGSFECSDNLLNRVWQIGAYTVRLNLDPQATGSILRPDRGDRYPWMGDTRVSHHTLFDVFGDYDLARADFNYFVTRGAKNISINGIPGYTLDWVIAMDDYYLYSGDLSIARYHLPDIKSILTSLDTTGTPPGWLFTDWEPGLNGTSKRSVLAFHCKYLQAANAGIALARALGNHHDVVDFSNRRDAMLRFLKQDPRWPTRLPRHSITDLILAGYANRYPKSMLSGSATPYFTYFIVQALSDVGQDQRALNTIRKTWVKMVKLGATTTWEFFQTPWGKVYSGKRQPPEIASMINDTISLCHPWSSGATAWLSDHVLGITPLTHGFKTCLIQPFFGDLKFAHGSVPTPHGQIHVSWHRVGERLELTFSAPKGVSIHLSMPSWHRWRLEGRKSGSGIHDWVLPGGRSYTVISIG